MKSSLSIKAMAKEERPREKLLKLGANSLSNEELLAIMIRTGTKEISAIELARKIINMDKTGISYLTNVTLQELQKIKGIGLAKACQILAALEFGKRISKSKINSISLNSPSKIANLFMQEFIFLKKEVFKIILLNTKNELIVDLNVSVGILNATIVHPREIFIEAIKRSSNSIILMHNHPSGNPSPSIEDKNLTKRLLEGGRILGISILDHIIIGDGIYFSFKEQGLL